MNNDLTAYNCVAVVTADGKMLAVEYKSDATGDMYYRPDVDDALRALRAQLAEAQAERDQACAALAEAEADTLDATERVILMRRDNQRAAAARRVAAYCRELRRLLAEALPFVRDAGDEAAQFGLNDEADDVRTLANRIAAAQPPAPTTPPGGEE